MARFTKSFFLIFFSFLMACSHEGSSQNISYSQELKPGAVRRAVFDLGSGTFKFKIADVESNTQKVVTYLPLPKNLARIKVDGSSDLARSGQSKLLSPEYIKNATDAFGQMVEKARQDGATEFVAVATGIFRDAANSKDVLQAMEAATRVRPVVISSATESHLGFYAGVSQFPDESNRVVVWDIGGQSMQFSTQNPQGSIVGFTGGFASITFKDTIISQIQKLNILEIKTPNPISKENVEKAELLIKKESKMKMDSFILQKLKDPVTHVVGIGGVHFQCISRQMGYRSEYTLSDIQALLMERISKKHTDKTLSEETKTAYPETDISNIVLVYSYMKKFGINSVRPINADNTDGLLVAPAGVLSEIN